MEKHNVIKSGIYNPLLLHCIGRLVRGFKTKKLGVIYQIDTVYSRYPTYSIAWDDGTQSDPGFICWDFNEDLPRKVEDFFTPYCLTYAAIEGLTIIRVFLENIKNGIPHDEKRLKYFYDLLHNESNWVEVPYVIERPKETDY